ncbi:MAG: hypothetical protein EPO24_05755 [Bacteroidetes bacterium]|nr:MAG: hypothetical protein EPO24_05755 [Bacteroidota bacterium]
MLSVLRCINVLVLLTLVVSAPLLSQKKKSVLAQQATMGNAVQYPQSIRQGFTMRVWMNDRLTFGSEAAGWDNKPPSDENEASRIGLEYPIGSGIEHLFAAGPYIGGIINGVRYVSETYNSNTGYNSFFPSPVGSKRNRIWETSRDDTLCDNSLIGFYKCPPGKRGVDDDGDGTVDEDDLDGDDNDSDWVAVTDDLGADGIPDELETGCNGGYDPVTNPDPAYDNYQPAIEDICHPDALGRRPLKRDKDIYTEKNGIPDHGEPHVDEDYAALSEHDVYISATDTVASLASSGHYPMGIKIVMKSYAWQRQIQDPILPIEYTIINVGRHTIHDLYFGFFADMDVGPSDVGSYWTQNYAAYMESLRTAYIHNPVIRGATPLGVTVLITPRRFDKLIYTYQWHTFEPPCGGFTDSELYGCISCEAFDRVNCIKPDQSQNFLRDARFTIGLGPFNDSTGIGIMPGDTLKIELAFVSGDGVDKGENPLLENAKLALLYSQNDYRAQVVPPSPCLEIATESGYATLRWGRTRPSCPVPQEAWDDSNKYPELGTDTSWRRSNPPPGHSSGGRIFEGYRVYRSEDPNGRPSSFVLLRQYDVIDGFNYDVGLDTVFVDSSAKRGYSYWYSVTSFSIPTLMIRERADSSGNVQHDSIIFPGKESSLLENMTKYYVNYGGSQQLGEVLVVPNPYRGDISYTNGVGFEGMEYTWTDYKRMVRFIRLPSKATIRIYTIAGEIIHTIYHDEQSGGITGQEDFYLFSESGRPLAPGIFVFTVESEYGTQTGKFVVYK